jgi:PDZ domain-containing secreted protein
VDYKNKNFYFIPFSSNEIDVREKQFAISFVPKNNKLFVSTLWENYLYDKISAGDQVISIDGVNYENVSICDLILKSILADKDKINLKTKNKAGAIIETLIERK